MCFDPKSNETLISGVVCEKGGGAGFAGGGGGWSCFVGWRPGTNLAKQKEVNTCIDLCGSGRVGVTGWF